MLILQITDAEIKSFNELKNNQERYAVISTITSDDIFNRFRDKAKIYSFISGGTATTIKEDRFIKQSSYTWNEIGTDNYDIFTKFVPQKSFKVKVKIKKIVNFSPKISLA